MFWLSEELNGLQPGVKMHSAFVQLVFMSGLIDYNGTNWLVAAWVRILYSTPHGHIAANTAIIQHSSETVMFRHTQTRRNG